MVLCTCVFSRVCVFVYVCCFGYVACPCGEDGRRRVLRGTPCVRSFARACACACVGAWRDGDGSRERGGGGEGVRAGGVRVKENRIVRA